jgi:hypothetical protein
VLFRSSVRVAEGFIPDEVLKEQGIQNTVMISKEQEASIPTIESLERADITGEDLRLINEGANSKEGKQHAEYKKSVESDEVKIDAKPSKPEFKTSEEILKEENDFKGRTPEDVINGKKPPKDYTPSDPRGFQPYDGTNVAARAENRRKAKDVRLLESALGRKLTEDEKQELGLLPARESYVNLDGQEDKSNWRTFGGPDVRKDLKAELAGKKKTPVDVAAKKDPKDMSWDELKEEIETPNPTDLERYNKAIREFYRKGGYSQPRQPQGPDQEDSVVEDAFDKADSGEDVPDLDSLIKAIKSPPKDTNKIQTKKRFPIELEPGMVVRDKGANFIVQDKPKRAGTTKDGLIQVTSFNVVQEGKKEGLCMA